jgi:hypothetical protein
MSVIKTFIDSYKTKGKPTKTVDINGTVFAREGKLVTDLTSRDSPIVLDDDFFTSLESGNLTKVVTNMDNMRKVLYKEKNRSKILNRAEEIMALGSEILLQRQKFNKYRALELRAKATMGVKKSQATLGDERIVNKWKEYRKKSKAAAKRIIELKKTAQTVKNKPLRLSELNVYEKQLQNFVNPEVNEDLLLDRSTTKGTSADSLKPAARAVGYEMDVTTPDTVMIGTEAIDVGRK